MDKSWMGAARNTQQYRDGVAKFMEYAVTNYKIAMNIDPIEEIKKLEIPCPCTVCVNHICRGVEDVDYHLFRHGIDQNYTNWTKHGEKETPARNVVFEGNRARDTSDFDDSPDFTTEKPTDATETVHMVEATEENFLGNPDKFKKLIEDAEKPLYKGCPDFTKLSAVVHLLNLKSKFGVSDKCFTEFLVLFKKMLPQDNELCSSAYAAKKAMKDMGSGYTKIHACVNNCILYRNEYKDMTVCPTCGKSRWKVDEKINKTYENVPAKVLWYFDIITRMKRLFQSKTIAKDLVWHATERQVDQSVLRHPADSPAWAAIDDNFPDFAQEPRNLRLGISADGVDVHRGNRNHSVWPILIVIYNLPPWLCMKRKFIMLSLLISGTPGNDIDVFLAPLIDDLHLLFEVGVQTYDAYKQENFTLRAVVLWTINDYPALGTLCGCPYSGYKGCVVCGEQTDCIRLPESNKQSYAGHRRYLPYNHPFRTQTKAFNGKQEFAPCPKAMNGEEIYNKVRYIKNKWGKGAKIKESEVEQNSTGRGGKIKKRKRTSKEASTSDFREDQTTYWKKFNIWYQRLRYWRYNSVQHCLDFMHIEKNVAESLVGTLLNVPFKTKDGLKARSDLESFGIKPELHPKRHGNNTTLPPAGYTLTTEEKDKFCETLYNLRVPEGYCSNFSNLVSLRDRKLIGLKSHDYHMIMQQFLPIAIRSIMHPPTRYAIIRFSFFFKSICKKEIKVDEIDKLQEELCVTLCLLEKFFPPSFFDVMVHLTVHLTREVKLCGPIFFRWMYPFERCMKVIKDHVRSKSNPEGCIAEENVAEETIEFFSEFIKNMNTVGVPLDKHNNSGIENGEELHSLIDGTALSAGKTVDVSPELFTKAHLYVLQNTNEVEPYIKRHMEVLENQHPTKRKAWLEQEHSKTFGTWLRKEVERDLAISRESISESLRWISDGPNKNVTKYEAFAINGYRFRTKRREGKVHQDSGVSVVANDMHISSKQVVTYVKKHYYGVLQEIWVLDYHVKRIALFMCDWVDNRGGVKKDSLGYTLVDLKKIGPKNDPFILASQAQQVFYVTDQLEKKMSIVFKTPPKNYRDAYEDVDEEFSTEVFPQNDNILPRVDPIDLLKESRNDYFRTDCRGIVLRQVRERPAAQKKAREN